MDFYDSPLSALLYDLQHNGDPLLDAERDFFVEVMRRDGGRVIDLGCGTGRILVPAAKRGIDIVGCDRSEPFLARARERAAAEGVRVPIVRCDLSEAALGVECFDIAFTAFRTFDHVVDDDPRASFMEAVFDALKPGGAFWVNVANPDPLALESAVGQKVLMRDDLVDEASKRRIVWWGVSHFDPNTRLIFESAQYDFLDETGRIDASYYFPFLMRWTPAEEFADLAERAGFEVAGRWGGFEWDPFEHGTGDSVWELRKPGLI